MSLRQLARTAGVSNPYLSQIERGLRTPSAEILQQIARGLRISAEALYVRAGILEERPAGRRRRRGPRRPPPQRAAQAGRCSTSTGPSAGTPPPFPRARCDRARRDSIGVIPMAFSAPEPGDARRAADATSPSGPAHHPAGERGATAQAPAGRAGCRRRRRGGRRAGVRRRLRGRDVHAEDGAAARRRPAGGARGAARALLGRGAASGAGVLPGAGRARVRRVRRARRGGVGAACAAGRRRSRRRRGRARRPERLQRAAPRTRSST